MKKYITGLLALLTAASLASCTGNQNSSSESSGQTGNSVSESQDKENSGASEAVSGYEKFVPDDALKNEFASVSGILIIGVWIAVISTVGLIANNYLTYKKNERSYLVMLTVGAKRRDITVLYLLRMPVCIGIALPLSFGASKLFSLWQGIELTGGGSIAFSRLAGIMRYSFERER